MVSGQHRLG
uniref:Uncharacterized protein n=1 Tax=Anguilla anguilla TaxID=7936 RepID=A0A0E9U8N1_ANGAN